MSFKQYIFQCVYFILHFIYTQLELGFSTIKSCVDFCHAIYYSSNRGTNLNRKLNTISKPPRHLTILLGHEVPSYKDLANLILWCTATRIPFISFYDYKGVLKKQHSQLEYEVNRSKQEEDHIIWHHDSKTPYKNGYKGRKIHVKILSPEDGKNSIVNVCKKIASKEVTTDFSVNSIDGILSQKYEFPDPDLGLYCGNVFSLYEYPQWQIRVTEFLNIETHHNITFDVFVDKILRYSKCEQRLGK